MRKVYFFATLILCALSNADAQTQEISGFIIDSLTRDTIPFASVEAKQNGAPVDAVMADGHGFYTLKLDPGIYDIEVSLLNYRPKILSRVVVSSNKNTTRNIELSQGDSVLPPTVITDEKILVDPDQVGHPIILTARELEYNPGTTIEAILTTGPGVTLGGDGKTLHFFGGRADASEVYIDNIRVVGSYNVPVSSISEIKIYSSGISAQFGDATSTIIAIITKGPSRDFGGTADVSTSQGMDAYGFTRATLNLTGPIIVNGKNEEENEKGRVALGYFAAVEYVHQQDANPSAVGIYRATDETLEYLEENPLVPSPSSDAFISTAETITMDGLEKVQTKPNVAENFYSFSGKLEAKPTQYITLAAGGNYITTVRHDWIDRYSLFNFVNNPLFHETTWRVYGRFRQLFGSKGSQASEKKEDGGSSRLKWEVQNAWYQVQFDYTKVHNTFRDDSHGFNSFNYGTIGTFDILKAPIYTFGDDPVSGNQGWLLSGYQDTLVRFAPSTVNPTGTAYTDKYYELAGGSLINGWWTAPRGGAQSGYYESLDQIQVNGGMLNGDRPRIAHDIWYNTGRQFNGHGISSDNDRYALNLLGALDIRKVGNKHSIEFGFEFEQRIERNYQVSAIGLWELMRQLANKHIDQLDTDNPLLLIDGEIYSYNDPNAPAFGLDDTILYNRKYVAANQSYFDRSLRRKLGLADDNTDFINTDAYGPDFYSLDMFSAEELLNSGNPYVFYAGYDYLGNRLTKQPSFDDFFHQKDATGNYTRAIGAYRPIYSAAFVQDKFNFRSLLFNIGVRIDRFDANQKVLRDPYTLYRTYTVGEALPRLEGVVPANIGNDYVVYVDDFTKVTPVPLGYRDGDTWYTADGAETNDPKIIAQSSATGRITPFLVNPNDNIKSENFDPSASFADYKPQITVMPRISFSFNLKDKSKFFAHYDIMTQRPQGGIFTSPDVWYFFNENITSIINNPALKPEKTIDYQIGFQQELTENMALTLTGYYREMRDMVQVINVPYAYPRDYQTFGNVDFGTVKGFSIMYEKLKGESPFSMNFNYTIQFADGTGSNSTSQVNLIGSGQPNLRTIAPLDFDSRHNINLSMEYAYEGGINYRGPVTKKGRKILSNSGVNIVARAKSGSPYTQQDNATAEALSSQASRKILSGSLNGSRMPWNFRLDLRIWKEFVLNKKEREDGHRYSMNVYFLVQNLLGTANVISVYPYTGNANDDGYLTSAIGQQDIAGKVNAESYQDLYRAYLDGGLNGAGGSRYSLPRNMRVGAVLKF